MSDEDRAQTMAVKLATYAQRAGVSPALVVDAYKGALELRLAVLRNVFHPDLLHPARSVLILLEDAACTDNHVLAAAAVTETEFPEMRLDPTRIAQRFGSEVAELTNAVPVPAESGDELAEKLVTAPEHVGLIAVAERLDHARHLHFREPGVWRRFYSEMVDVYLPFAERLNQQMARRISRWAGAFEKRFPR